ncbi:MAG: heme-binding protein [Actinobacteria bacterium]|nr:heme-binding protein [Actinomycetota bacterium]
MEIDLALALDMVEAAKRKAVEIGVPMSIAVLDAGANLLAFNRMDGAELAGPNLAVDKAYTSVTNRIATGELRERIAPDGDLPGMNANGSGRYIAFAGGIPCWDGDSVVGAIGVSGGSWDDDQVCALAAIDVFSKACN